MYIRRFDAMLAFLETAFPEMEVRGDIREFSSCKNDDPLQLTKGICSLTMGPAWGFSDHLNQDPLGRQIVHVVLQKTGDRSASGDVQQRASLALMERLRLLQNSPDLPAEASGLVLRDIVPNTTLVPDVEVIATYEVPDNG